MADRHDEDRIATEFRRLRDKELGAAPPFRDLSKPVDATKQRRSIPRLAVMAALLTLLLGAVVFLEPIRKEHPVESTAESTQFTAEVKMALTRELPTDFLLDTPNLEFATTTPRFGISIPSYEPLEVLQDER